MDNFDADPRRLNAPWREARGDRAEGRTMRKRSGRNGFLIWQAVRGAVALDRVAPIAVIRVTWRWLVRCCLLISVLALAGCADRPMPAAPGGESLRDGPAVPMQLWRADAQEEAVILALHGFGDSGALTFPGAAAAWNARGITVYAPDQRGFGASVTRKRWPGSAALISDAIALSREIRRRHPSVPLVVVGHSMGAAVALAAASEGLDADALVLAAPAITGGGEIDPFSRAGAWTLSMFLPDRRWSAERVIDVRPSDNVVAMRLVSRDPRHFATPSSRELYGLLRLMDRAAAAAPQVDLPVITLMGKKDGFLNPARVRRAHETIAGAGAFIFYEEGWHWLFRDLQAARVWGDVGDFVLAQRARP